jgi:hypothetical protein
MIHTRTVLALTCVLALGLAALTAQAAPMTAYSKDAFVAAQNAGQPIVVYVHANW